MEQTQSNEGIVREGPSASVQSPGKPRYADRFMPSRAGNSWDITFPETPKKKKSLPKKVTTTLDQEDDGTGSPSVTDEEEKTMTYSCLLKNEVLGYDFDAASVFSSPKKKVQRRLFHFDSTERPVKTPNSDSFSPYSSSPLSTHSSELIRTPVRKRRRIPKSPFKVLDAPELADDYYLNLLDWSKCDIICVGLGNHVYTWSAATCSVNLITDLTPKEDQPTSVKWNDKGNLLAFGTGRGVVNIWDIEAEKVVLEKKTHDMRIGALDWNGDVIFSGSRDKTIKISDIRSSGVERVLGGHKQEVCGLRWSGFNATLASGGNDNAVMLWNMHSRKPLATLSGHGAAVKALSWSPHERHFLASGGGTSDRCLKFWNTITVTCTSTVNTESQVCNVAWSPHSKELVTSHGFAHNNIVVWKYPTMKRIASLKGHTQRVLYMAMSPDGNSVCSGASDETIRFWKVFERTGSRVRKSSLDLFDGIR